jgi:hypothetical protein
LDEVFVFDFARGEFELQDVFELDPRFGQFSLQLLRFEVDEIGDRPVVYQFVVLNDQNPLVGPDESFISLETLPRFVFKPDTKLLIYFSLLDAELPVILTVKFLLWH